MAGAKGRLSTRPQLDYNTEFAGFNLFTSPFNLNFKPVGQSVHSWLALTKFADCDLSEKKA